MSSVTVYVLNTKVTSVKQCGRDLEHDEDILNNNNERCFHILIVLENSWTYSLIFTLVHGISI